VKQGLAVFGFGIAALAAAMPAPARAEGNKFTFARADASAVDYRATRHRAAMSCEQLGRNGGDTAALKVERVPATAQVPEHCRIDGVLKSGAGFQVNLPMAWNGRLYMYGNGGFAGEDAEAPHEQASRDRGLANGFATARTDTGHLAASEPLASFARDRRKLVNHGYRAVHDTATYAKTLAAIFYGTRPRRAYWDGCSTGGREGVMSAQRYPADFDGIVAGAPTLDWSSIMIKGLWDRQALAGSGLSFDKMGLVFKAVIAKCDALDGVADGLIDDPRRCNFDPQRDLPACRDGGATADCFTASETEALRKIYAGPPKGAATPSWLFQTPGSEQPSTLFPFTMMRDGSPDVLSIFAASWMKYIGFKNPDYDPAQFDFASDPARIRGADVLFNPTPDLAAFKARGGKMITFWGWADTALNPQMGIDYYDRVVGRLGLPATQSFYRLFLIPGVAHCGGGYGPEEIDAMTDVINWVEKGITPDRLPARRRSTDGSPSYNRAYCPYPAATRYDGSGDREDPQSYSCAAPPEPAEPAEQK